MWFFPVSYNFSRWKIQGNITDLWFQFISFFLSYLVEPLREKELTGVLGVTCSLTILLYQKNGPTGLGKPSTS